MRAASLLYPSARLTRAARAYRFGSDRELQHALHTFASAVEENAAHDETASSAAGRNSDEEASACAQDERPCEHPSTTSPLADPGAAHSPDMHAIKQELTGLAQHHQGAGPIADEDEASELPPAVST
jgi:hypothetical protein